MIRRQSLSSGPDRAGGANPIRRDTPTRSSGWDFAVLKSERHDPVTRAATTSIARGRGLAANDPNVLWYANYVGALTSLEVITSLDGMANFTFTGTVTYSEVHLLDSGGSSETPLPAALPLFVTGLGALGLLGWRRKHRIVKVRKEKKNCP